MNEFHGRASKQVAAAPQAIFDLITDVNRLPDWNQAIESVVSRPAALTVGEEWVVRMHPPRVPSWGSASTVEVCDPATRRFAYETRNTDGNASRVKWAWSVDAAGSGSDVTVTWDCTLKGVDRRFLAGPLRKRQLAREVPASLDRLEAALTDG